MRILWWRRLSTRIHPSYCKIGIGAKNFMPTVAVSLTSEEEAALIAQAKTHGISVDSLVRKAVLQIILPSTGTGPSIDGRRVRESFRRNRRNDSRRCTYPLQRCSRQGEHLYSGRRLEYGQLRTAVIGIWVLSILPLTLNPTGIR